MGHAIHFLERLSRVNAQHVERALWMYQNGPVLRDVLQQLPLPDGAERVAVSLEDDVHGPFVIVTRTGAFVTCLAAGMRPGGRPIVSRHSFERASAKTAFVHEQAKQLQRVASALPEGGIARLTRRLDSAGLRFCREDADLIARMLPLFLPDILGQAMEAMENAQELTQSLRDIKRQKRVPRAQLAYVVSGYEGLIWAAANALPFLGVHGAWGPEDDESQLRLNDMRLELARECFAWGSGLHAYRAIWLALQSGPAGRAQLMREPEPSDPGGRAFRTLVLEAFDCAGRGERAENDQTLPLSREIARASQLCIGGAWFLSPRHALHLARIRSTLPRLVRASVQELYPYKSELEHGVVANKPSLDRWFHRYPGSYHAPRSVFAPRRIGI